MMELPAARFLRLAERLPAFQGVLQARLAHERSQGSEDSSATTTAQPHRGPGADHPTAQRVNVLNLGGAVATTTLDRPSYLHELLRTT